MSSLFFSRTPANNHSMLKYITSRSFVQLLFQGKEKTLGSECQRDASMKVTDNAPLTFHWVDCVHMTTPGKRPWELEWAAIYQAMIHML